MPRIEAVETTTGNTEHDRQQNAGDPGRKILASW
jgi:hypothetical protein